MLESLLLRFVREMLSDKPLLFILMLSLMPRFQINKNFQFVELAVHNLQMETN